MDNRTELPQIKDETGFLLEDHLGRADPVIVRNLNGQAVIVKRKIDP